MIPFYNMLDENDHSQHVMVKKFMFVIVWYHLCAAHSAIGLVVRGGPRGPRAVRSDCAGGARARGGGGPAAAGAE